MRKLKPLTAKNVDTGETREIPFDAHAATSVADWKPVPPERFAQLIHHYTTQDQSIDDMGHNEMSFRSFHISGTTTATIHYVPKSIGDPVSQPVLLSIYDEDTGKTIFFGSLRYGVLAEHHHTHG